MPGPFDPPIENLVLSDTFFVWLNRTNQIIDGVNPLKIYDVLVESSMGLVETGRSGFVVRIGVNDGDGLGFGGDGELKLDFEPLTASAGVQNADLYVLQEAATGEIRKVQATNMFPPNISGDVTFNDNVTITGNLTVIGDTIVFDSANTRFNDILLELGFVIDEEVELDTTSSAATPTPDEFVTVTVASGDPTVADDVVLTAFIKSWDSGESKIVISALTPSAGPNSDNSIVGGYEFYDEDDAYLGAADGNGVQIEGDLGDNDAVDGGGIRLLSSDGHKDWRWRDETNAWTSNVNIALDDINSHLLASRFKSSNHIWTFAGDETATVAQTIIIGDALTANNKMFLRHFGNNRSVVNDATNGQVDGPGFLELGQQTGASSISPIFRIRPSDGFAHLLNADKVDGADASLEPTGGNVPIAYSDGKIDAGWIPGIENISKTVTQNNHGFTVGQAVRVNDSAVYVLAQADSAASAETVGIVSQIIDANTFVVVWSGSIDLSSVTSSLVPGNAYFLSPTVAGAFTSTEPTAPGLVRKVLFIATDSGEAVVTPYIGKILSEPQDVAYFKGIVPVGTIQSYAGDESTLPANWLICNGRLLDNADFAELYTVVGNNNHIRVAASSYPTSSTVQFSLSGGNRNIENGTLLKIKWNDGTERTRTGMVAAVSGNNVTLSGGSGDSINNAYTGVYRIFADDSTGEFFLPDLRGRAPIGAGEGDTTSERTLFEIVGNETITLTEDQLPEHSHTVFGISAAQPGSGAISLAENSSTHNQTSGTTGSGDAIDITPASVVFNWIIRAIPDNDATIIEGHNHDDRYVRFDTVVAPPYNSTQRANARTNIEAAPTIHTHDDLYPRYNIVNVLGSSDASRFRANTDTARSPWSPTNTDGHTHDNRYVTFTASQSLTAAQRTQINANLGSLPIIGGTLTGNLNMGGNRITNLGDPVNNTDAANRQFVTGITNTLLPRSGGSGAPMTGQLFMGGNRIRGLGNGIDPQDAVTIAQHNTKASLSGATFTGNVTIGNGASLSLGGLADGTGSNNNRITNLDDPQNGGDAVNRNWALNSGAIIVRDKTGAFPQQNINTRITFDSTKGGINMNAPGSSQFEIASQGRERDNAGFGQNIVFRMSYAENMHDATNVLKVENMLYDSYRIFESNMRYRPTEISSSEYADDDNATARPRTVVAALPQTLFSGIPEGQYKITMSTITSGFWSRADQTLQFGSFQTGSNGSVIGGAARFLSFVTVNGVDNTKYYRDNPDGTSEATFTFLINVGSNGLVQMSNWANIYQIEHMILERVGNPVWQTTPSNPTTR